MLLQCCCTWPLPSYSHRTGEAAAIGAPGMPAEGFRFFLLCEKRICLFRVPKTGDQSTFICSFVLPCTVVPIYDLRFYMGLLHQALMQSRSGSLMIRDPDT